MIAASSHRIVRANGLGVTLPRLANVHSRHRVALLTIALIGAFGYVAAYIIRFDLDADELPWELMVRTLPIFVCIRVATAVAHRLHLMLLLRVTVADVRRALAATSVGSLILLAVVVIARRLGWEYLGAVPYGVIILDWGLSIGGMQMVWLGSAFGRASEAPQGRKRVVIVGAGESGISLALQMQRSPHHRLHPVAFVDDDPRKHHGTISGIPIEGASEQLPSVAREYQADLILIAVPRATPAETRKIIGYCQKTDVPYRILPSVAELVDGHVDLARVREIDVADLLARPMADIDHEVISELIENRRILVTGGGGSVGSELARQIARLKPQALVLVDHAENSIFAIEAQIRREFPDLDLRTLIVDVTDRVSLQRTLRDLKPHAVFHAAAHKHVPLMEVVPGEAVRNNVGGTLNAAEASIAAGVECFVLVSTDKAVRPSSVMGATKRLCELVVNDLVQLGDTRFTTVRFGNVLGSNGSVVPIFQEQLRAGGPITVTDERMERYFMALPEAAGLILEAGAVGSSGQTFILDMGAPVRIIDLAETMVRMHGLTPYQDIDIVITGIRPGEKLTEALNYDAEEFVSSGRDKLLVVPEADPRHVLPSVRKFLAELPDLAPMVVRERLWELIREDDSDLARSRALPTDLVSRGSPTTKSSA